MKSFELSRWEDGKRVWVRPYDGQTELQGDVFDNASDAMEATEYMAQQFGWAEGDYQITSDID